MITNTIEFTEEPLLIMAALRRFVFMVVALPTMLYGWKLYDDFLRYHVFEQCNSV